MLELLTLMVASLLAGFIDAVVGGGGLVAVPALFGVYPQAPPATLLGTNKAAAIWGTALAARQYARRVSLRWSALIPACVVTFGGGFLGAWVVTMVSPDGLRKVLPFVLLVVLMYTLAKKEFGHTHEPGHTALTERWLIGAIGLVVGFYDGFFGPGCGSFFIFLLVRWLGYDFLTASSNAKVLNTATNLAALILFALKGHVWWHTALPMALANMMGSVAGAHMSLKHGTHFVRITFIVVVSLLILKTAWDAWLRTYFL
jgi:uncharacterized protein